MPSVHCTCPECGRAFEMVWMDETAARRQELVQCPYETNGADCPGMVEVDVPPDAVAVASPGAPA